MIRSTRHRTGCSRHALRPRLEFLEARTVLSTISTLDSTFGNGGMALTNISRPGAVHGNAAGSALAVQQSDGKTVVVGASYDDAWRNPMVALARYNTDGSLDSNFGGGGLVVEGFGLSSSATAVALQSDGKIVVAGSVVLPHTSTVFLVARFTPSGAPDKTFGDDDPNQPGQKTGWTTADFGNHNDIARGVTIQPSDGSIVVAGNIYWPDSLTNDEFGVTRFDGSGKQDPSFGTGGTGGWATARFRDWDPYSSFGLTYEDDVAGVVVQHDGSIVVAGGSQDLDIPTAVMALARFTTGGQLDLGFGGKGTGLATVSGFATSVALQPDDKIVLGGAVTQPVTFDSVAAVARFTANGTLDPTFGTNGLVAEDDFHRQQFAGVALQADGKIVAASGILTGRSYSNTQYSDAWVKRFTAAGVTDPTFDGGVLATATFNAAGIPVNSSPAGVAVTPDGKVMVAGSGISGDSLSATVSFEVARFWGVSDQLPTLINQSGQPDQVTFSAASGAQVDAVVSAINSLPAVASGGSLTVTIDLAGATTTTNTPLNAPSGVQITLVSSSGNATVQGVTVSGGDVTVGDGVTPVDWTVNAGNVVVQGGAPAGDFVVNGGTVTLADGTVITGHSPAITLNGGNVILLGVTVQTATDSPTIVVNGGSLKVRGSTIEESTGYSQAAILVTGGTVDLGTAADPGGNVIDVNGAGELVHDSGGAPIPAVGDTFTVDGVPITPSSLSGVVFADFNRDGQVDFGETGIAGVVINLDGTDFLGNHVHLSQTTDGAGSYVFLNLEPGTYTINEPQVPAGYTQGVNMPGTAGGTVSGNRFSVFLGPSLDAMNYNYGERPAATGRVRAGQTAEIGFWNNRRGQDLIKALNGGGTSTQLGDWLAATFPNLFGAQAGVSNLAGKTNAQVAAAFQARFVIRGIKVDAQVLATALSVYVTNATLNDTGVGVQYGFLVSGYGVGTAGLINVGPYGDTFGVANNTTLTVLDLLLAVDRRAVNGVLFNGNAVKRAIADLVFGLINKAGGI